MTKSAPISAGVRQAKTHLSELLRLVEAGQEVEITRGGTPVARLIPSGPQGQRRLGTDEGVFTVPDDFDDPLPADILENFYA
ncbi:MAG: antitoxin [Actinobacteria bacterium 69-20]|nr:type II toxin-antitoxin system Phd/YefM family antitoxin [Actinomycetota bacterium]OJV31327.1 MAG: antitoxin [Actinobacteria bacterium 69-20]